MGNDVSQFLIGRDGYVVMLDNGQNGQWSMMIRDVADMGQEQFTT